MKFLCLSLVLNLFVQTARAATLNFSARIDDENLAEEAILLVHCLSDRTGNGWEYTDTKGANWLEVHQTGSAELGGAYHKEGRDAPFTMHTGGSDEACDKLEPHAISLAPTIPLNAETPSLGMLSAADVEERRIPSSAWIYAAGAVALVGGFFLWKAHQPTYGSVDMH